MLSAGVDNRRSIEGQRAGVPALRNASFFNYGAQGPLPAVASAAIRDAYTDLDALGTFSTETYAWSLDVQRRARVAFGRTMGTTPASVALVENVTAGCAAVLWGIEWRSGDHVVTTDLEYPGVLALIHEIAQRFRLRVTVSAIAGVEDPETAAAHIGAQLTASTQLIVSSHVFWNTGLRLPIDALIAARDKRAPQALLFVDGAQAAGMMPVNVDRERIDFYCCPASKWLCGPTGVAALAVGSSAARRVRPALAGWRGLMAQEARDTRTAARLEGGTPAFPLYAGASAAAAFHECWGTAAAIHDRIRSLARRLWAQLGDLESPASPIARGTTVPPETGIVTIRLRRGTPRDLALALEAEGCLVKAVRSPDAVRACVHYLTTEDEVDTLVARVREAALS